MYVEKKWKIIISEGLQVRFIQVNEVATENYSKQPKRFSWKTAGKVIQEALHFVDNDKQY